LIAVREAQIRRVTPYSPNEAERFAIMHILEFRSRFTQEPWYEPHGRQKLDKAILLFCIRIPRVAPPQNGAFTGKASSLTESDAVVFIPFHFEERSQEENDFALAHQFAHAILGHHLQPQFGEWSNDKKYFNHPSEIEADNLISSWGYKILEHRRLARHG
jgi:hypothetical protein